MAIAASTLRNVYKHNSNDASGTDVIPSAAGSIVVDTGFGRRRVVACVACSASVTAQVKDVYVLNDQGETGRFTIGATAVGGGAPGFDVAVSWIAKVL